MATPRYLPDSGGTEIHTHEVAERLAARGTQVTVVATTLEPHARTREAQGPVQVVRVRAWPRGRDWYFAPALARAIRRLRPDVVHCQGYHTLVAPTAMLAALAAGIPYVVTFHSGGHSSALRTRARPLQALVLRPLLKRARRLIAVSQFEARHFADQLRLPLTAFEVIPSGVELPPLAGGERPLEPPLLLSVGRVERYKGHHRVVEALPALARARPGIRLRVAGSGPYELALRRLADDLGVGELVEIGPVPAGRRDEMGRLLQHAGVVAALSEYESQGLGVQEAVGVGRPVVVSAGSALAELRDHPNVAVVAESAGPDEIAGAILDLLAREPVPPPAMPTWDECVASLERVYRAALG